MGTDSNLSTYHGICTRQHLDVFHWILNYSRLIVLRFVLIHIDNIIFITLREFTDRFDILLLCRVLKIFQKCRYFLLIVDPS